MDRSGIWATHRAVTCLDVPIGAYAETKMRRSDGTME